jgi:predicted RNase H-like HicB family nuclease
MKRRVIVYQDESGAWCALCPSLSAFSEGESRDDAIANIKELLPTWIEETFKDAPIPKDNGHIKIVTISLEPYRQQ